MIADLSNDIFYFRRSFIRKLKMAAYYLNHKDQIRSWNKSPDGRASQRKCRAKYKYRRALENKAHWQFSKKRLKDYLRSHPCVDCGCGDVRCLQFDHVRGEKCFNVSIATLKWEKIMAEIAKCEVRCANCHKIRHYKECE
jgi:hypothetical protein